MSDDSTPTLKQVRERFAWPFVDPEVGRRQREAFDRWLAEHDAGVARQQAEHDAQIAKEMGAVDMALAGVMAGKDVAVAILAQFGASHA